MYQGHLTHLSPGYSSVLLVLFYCDLIYDPQRTPVFTQDQDQHSIPNPLRLSTTKHHVSDDSSSFCRAYFGLLYVKCASVKVVSRVNIICYCVISLLI